MGNQGKTSKNTGNIGKTMEMHRNIGKLLYMLGTRYGVLHDILTRNPQYSLDVVNSLFISTLLYSFWLPRRKFPSLHFQSRKI